MLTHFTAKTLLQTPALNDRRACDWLWAHLRERFPEALSACLMPTHVHLVDDADDGAKNQFAQVLAGFARKFEHQRIWCPTQTSTFEGPIKLGRQSRYLHLNPVRAGLVQDPLAWRWSTHRGVIGAEVDPWVSAERLAAALGEKRDGFERRFHEYVSSDPSVHVGGSAFPTAATPTLETALPLAEVFKAAATATRGLPRIERRRAAVQLAWQLGWRDLDQLAYTLQWSKRTLRRDLQASNFALECSLLCAGDSRLR